KAASLAFAVDRDGPAGALKFDEVVVYGLNGLPLADVLDLVLGSLGLTFHVEEDGTVAVEAAPRPDENGDGPPVDSVEPLTDAQAQTWSLLARTSSFEFPRETTLEKFLNGLKAKAETPARKLDIYVDPVSLQEAEKTLKSPVEFRAEGVTYAHALHLILDQLG